MAQYRSAEWRKNIADSRRKHGLHNTKVYRAWIAMRRRCCDPNAHAFKDYGGRGITVDAAWMESFDQFYIDMGSPPTQRHSLGRIDNERGYCKSNCEWQTSRQQLRNTRANLRVSAFGESRVLQDWVSDSRCVVNYQTAWRRIQRLRWDHERALSTPAAHKDQSFRSHHVPA